MRRLPASGGFSPVNVPSSQRDSMHVAEEFQPILRQLGIDAPGMFTHPEIRPWRTLKDRENCTLDTVWPDGTPLRLHVKRFPKPSMFKNRMDEEVNGIRVLQMEKIPTVPLVGWGTLKDLRSFVITRDLTGWHPADRLIAAGTPFDMLLRPTAELTARLHNAGLHHRDLYLCHFYVKVTPPEFGSAPPKVDLRLIDAARVQRLGFMGRSRWLIKDLAQFWFSTLKLPITRMHRMEWLDVYAEVRKIEGVAKLQRAIQRKSDWIARHDAKLTASQPGRNISIPSLPPIG